MITNNYLSKFDIKKILLGNLLILKTFQTKNFWDIIEMMVK